MKRPSKKQLAARKKFIKMVKARARAAKKKHKKIRRKRKNPAYFVGQKGKSRRISRAYLTKRDVGALKKKKSRLVNALVSARGRGHKKGVMKSIQSRIHNRLKKIEQMVGANKARKLSALADARAMKQEGYKVKRKVVSKPLDKKVSKKKRKKRKESFMAKKRKKKAHRAKRRAPRRKRHARRKRRVVVLSKKRSSVVVRRKNPQVAQMLREYTGLDMKEAGGLLLGGALYGTVNGMAAKYLPQAYEIAAKVPVVGTTLVPFALGVAIKWAGKQFKVNALEMVGEGIVSAAVVGMGINAAQFVPGLHGVDYTPSLKGYLGSAPGRDPGSADFGGVDFTPGMGMQPQLGRDPGSADFGEIPQGLGMEPQLGEIPQGLA